MKIPAHLALCPGYAEAVKHENDVRDAAVLNLNALICGVEIRQMTLRHWLILDGIESPFLNGALPDPDKKDIEKFLWVLSPHFTPRWSFAKAQLVRRARKLPYGEAVVSIRSFVEDTFQDSPPSEGDDKWRAPEASFGANVICSLALRFHWSRDAILDLPLKESFQHLKLIRMRGEAERGEKPIGWNRSDEILNQHRRKVRAERAANN